MGDIQIQTIEVDKAYTNISNQYLAVIPLTTTIFQLTAHMSVIIQHFWCYGFRHTLYVMFSDRSSLSNENKEIRGDLSLANGLIITIQVWCSTHI